MTSTPFCEKKPWGRLPSQPPMACQLLKSPAPSRWPVSSDWAGLVSTTPLSLLSSSLDLAPPLSQPQWWSLIGVQFYHHQDCSSPHGPIHPISNHFPKSLLRRFRADATVTAIPQTLALLQADTKQWLSLNESHHKADRPQSGPAYSLLLCNFISQKQNWHQEDFIY